MTIADKILRAKSDYDAVHEAGYEKGKAEGGGKFYDEFWDAYQNGGNRRKYNYAFSGEGWTAETFKPKYPIIATDGSYAFDGAKIGNTTNPDFDFVERGIELDFSGATTLTYCFRNSRGIKRIGVFDATSCKDINRPFYYCSIVTIDELKVDEALKYDNAFAGAESLENVTVSGLIGQNGFNMGSCKKLSKDSITSIINALSPNTTGLTVTLSKTAAENAFADTDGEQAEISLSEKQSDGFYTVTFGSREDEWCILQFDVPMDISFHGAFLADSDIYEVDILRSGVYRLNMMEEVTATAQNGDELDLALFDLLSYGGPLKIKRTDGRDLSSGDVTAYMIGELNYKWFDLIATKPNWNIALV